MQQDSRAAIGDLLADLAPPVLSDHGFSSDHGGHFLTPIRTEQIGPSGDAFARLTLAYTLTGWYYGWLLLVGRCAWEVLPGCPRQGPFHCPNYLGPYGSTNAALSSAARESRYAIGQMLEFCPQALIADVQDLDTRLERLTREQAAAI